MLEIESVEALRAHIGQRLGSSDWMVVDQTMIDQFAEATGDHQWIHVDVERAKREMPGGSTIAHGYLTLSLLPRLNANIYSDQEPQARRELRLQQGALHRAGAVRARACAGT